MISFVFGRAGSGKSTFIEKRIKEDIVKGREVWLIVPEQQTYIAERHYAEILPPSSQLYFEVVNFSRLANKAFRLYGGLSYNYIDKGMKSLLMWHTLRDLAPLLEEYGAAAGDSRQVSKLTPMMLAISNELKIASTSPSSLEQAAAKLDEENHLRAKLRDISLICSAYSGLVAEKYDDASDDLAKLSELLETHNFFADKHIYIDSFTSYTAEEYKIIDRIFSTAASITVTVGCDSPDSDGIHMLSLKEAARRLRRSAKERGEVEDIILDGTKRFGSPDLAVLEKYLWQMEYSKLPKDEFVSPDAIDLVKCKDPYSEAEAAAVRIVEELRGGMRCRDIAVIVRDAKKWAGIVDAVFDKFSIPYFISERTDISSKPLFKLLISALRIKNRGWQQNDVISLLKTGLCGIDDREVDIFENYCNTWNINGRAFTGDVWSMNPDGYSATVSDRGREMLLVANDVKRRLTEPLIILFTELDGASSAGEMCSAVYEYTERIGLRESLAAIAEKELSAGNRREYGETMRLYSVYIDALEKLADALSEERPDCEEFASALSTLLDNTDMGSLPTRQDEVTIGSASMLRADSPRLVIVMGLNDGEFPADVSDAGILSAADRITLADLGIELSADRAVRSSEELFYVYRAFTAPSEKLMLTCSETTASGGRREPSVPFLRTASLFGGIIPRDYDGGSALARLQTPEIALEYLKSLGDTPVASALRSSLSKLDGIKDAVKALDIPLSDADCAVSPETAHELFGDRLSISQSRLETYSRCHFNYFCDYVLGLREDSRAEFAASQTGDFIHHIMEKFMRESIRDGKFNCDFTDDEAKELARSIIADYAARIIPDSDERAERLSYLFSRLERIALMMIINIRREFSHSLFSPSFFELKIDGTDPIFPDAASIDTGNGTEVSLRGIVDRVDLFRRGKDVYIRVVDYKTGSREYSPADVADGLGLQLLLYLFTLCKCDSPEFRNALGCPPDGKIYPAGALYLSANMPVITVDGDIDEGEIRREAEKAIKRSGPLLSDDVILEAMNDEFDPSYLGGVKKTKDGVTKGKNLLSSEEFDQLYDSINTTLTEISDEMRSGAASAVPKISKGKSPCDWCVYSAVCRSARPSELY